MSSAASGLHVDNVELLIQLKLFLTSFKQFTLLAKKSSLSMLLLLLVCTWITEFCQVHVVNDSTESVADSQPMKEVRAHVLKSL